MPSHARDELVAALLRTPTEPGAAVRVARSARRWSQAELGRRCGYSASQISRWENGRQPLRDVHTLRTLADVLALPPAVFGLGDTNERTSPPNREADSRMCRVTNPWAKEDDPVRRRAFLQLAALTGTTTGSPLVATAKDGMADPAQLLTQQLSGVLLSPSSAVEPTNLSTLAAALDRARHEFTSCNYINLAGRLPALIKAAEATVVQRPEASAHRLLARTYSLTTGVLTKLKSSGLEWLAADRALHAARTAEHPLTLAGAQRFVATVARRAGHYEHALNLTIAAVDHLRAHVTRPQPEHLDMYGALYLSASYAAARSGDRERADDLLAEAQNTAELLSDDVDRHQALLANLVSYQVSAAFALGDAGKALAHAQSLPLTAIPTTERRARLMIDTAQAWAQWDKPEQAYRTLLAAERSAPGEVHTRNAARRVVTDLLHTPKHATMPGLPALAQRIHAIER